MKKLFTSAKGMLIVLQTITLVVAFQVFSNEIVEGLAKA